MNKATPEKVALSGQTPVVKTTTNKVAPEKVDNEVGMTKGKTKDDLVIMVDEEKQRSKEKLQQLGKEIWLCRQFVHKPCIVTLIGAVFIILCTIGSTAGGYLTNSGQNDRDYLVWSHRYVYEWD